jgi:hypothetical protein
MYPAIRPLLAISHSKSGEKKKFHKKFSKITFSVAFVGYFV